ncbi:MAG TPA: hypothetical protein VNU26_18625 [Mycobacteriales bacterium]|nr:hypothetical protein [Mycobacteriales bacterium]
MTRKSTATERAERVVARSGTSAGGAAQRAGTALSRAGEVLEERSTAVAPAVGTAVGSALETAAETVAGVAAAVGDFLDEPAVRGTAALDALRGVPVGPPAAVRRWPWALGAAAVGAAAGAGVALLVRRLGGSDAPGAQEPHELRAVVDLPGEGTTGTSPGAAGAAQGTPGTPGAAPGDPTRSAPG